MFRTHVKLYLPSLCKRKPRFPLNKSNWLREIYVQATFAKICVGVVKCFSNFTKSHQLHQNIFWQFKARMALRKRLIAELNVAPKIGPFFNSKPTSSQEWSNKLSFLCLVFPVFLVQFFFRWKSTDGLYLVIFSAGHPRAIQRGLLPFRLQL